MTLPGSSQDENSDDEEDEISSESPVRRIAPLSQRKPDPRASRRSKRSEAQKPVNYSKKYHPQDYGLPGHRHRAILPPPTAQRRTPKLSQASRKRKPAVSEPVIPDSDELDENAVECVLARSSDDEDGAEGFMMKITPERQPLRNLHPNSRPTKKSRRSDGRGTNSPQVIISSRRTRSSSDVHLSDMFLLADTTLDTANDILTRDSSQTLDGPEASSATVAKSSFAKPTAPAFVALAVVRPYLSSTTVTKDLSGTAQDNEVETTSERCVKAPTSSEKSEDVRSHETLVDVNSKTGEPVAANADCSASSKQYSTAVAPRTTSEERLAAAYIHTMSDPRDDEAQSQSMSEHSDDDDADPEDMSEQSGIDGLNPGDMSQQSDIDGVNPEDLSDDGFDYQNPDTQHDAELASQTMSELCDAEDNYQIMAGAKDAATRLRAANEKATFDALRELWGDENGVTTHSQTMGEDHAVEGEQQSSHFDEAMAVTDGGAPGEVRSNHVDDEDDWMSSQLDEMPLSSESTSAVAAEPEKRSDSRVTFQPKPAREASRTRSEISVDPLDLLPKPSSLFPTTTSLPSTADPASDRIDSETVAPTMSSSLLEF